MLLEATFSLLKEFLIPKGRAADHGVTKTRKQLSGWTELTWKGSDSNASILSL